MAIHFAPAEQRLDFLTNMTFEADAGTGVQIADIGSLWFSDPVVVLESVGVKLRGQIYNLDAWNVNELEITDWRVRFRDENFTLTVTNDLIVRGANARLELGGTVVKNLFRATYLGVEGSVPRLLVGGDFTIANNGRFDIYSSVADAESENIGTEIVVNGKMTIAASGGCYVRSDPENGGSPIFRTGSLVVEQGGVFSANRFGCWGAASKGVAGYGPGAGKANADNNNAGGAGGYGGRGQMVPKPAGRLMVMPYGRLIPAVAVPLGTAVVKTAAG